MITRPTLMALNDWADIIVSDLQQFGTFNRLIGDDWKTWGAQFMLSPDLQNNIPQPQGFNDWREWAERLCQTIG